MRVISNRALREFAQTHADAQAPLQAWRHLIEKGTYATFADLRATFASVDKVGDRTVFNIGGNKVRLIAGIAFAAQIVWVKAVLTHADYDRGAWK